MAFEGEGMYLQIAQILVRKYFLQMKNDFKIRDETSFFSGKGQI